MAHNLVCAVCEHPLPADAPLNLCPSCLWEGAMLGEATPPDHDDEETAASLDETGPAWPDGWGVVGSGNGSGNGSGAPTEPDEDFLHLDHAFTLEEYLRACDHGSGSNGNGKHSRIEIPGYEIWGPLGRGGMGVVYLALQSRAHRYVALKMIRGGDDIHPAQRARFEAEARAVARLRHPNIVQVYDVGEVAGQPYFSLELLQGGSLRARLAQALMAPRAAAELLRVLARAIAAAHREGIVHRDLKPSNILFDSDGTPKITDFGLAKWLESDELATMPGQVVGTPSYMAPEQARGDNHAVGTAADVYALGGLLYEMLTGLQPFKGTTAANTLQLVLNQEPVRPSRFDRRVPRDLETICLKCLEKEPSRRYRTADDLADDLARFLNGTPILARPTPPWVRCAKWARRQPALATLIALGMAAAVGLVLGLARHEILIAQLRTRATADFETSRQLRAAGDPTRAKETLLTLLASLRHQPRLADLGRLAEAEKDDITRQLEADAARAECRERLARFRSLYHQALLLDGNAALSPVTMALSTGQGGDVPEAVASAAGDDEKGRATPTPRGREMRSLLPRLENNPRAVRDAAVQALEVFGMGPAAGRDAPGPLPDALSPDEQAEVNAGRYLLLLIFADALARPLPDESPRDQADAALLVLERARAIHAPTAAYHLRRAACLQLRGDADAARLARQESARVPALEGYDRFLLGQELIRAGDWYEARLNLEKAVRLRDDLFGAHCLLAIAQLNSDPPRAELARFELTRCIDLQPSASWLYLLRGYARGHAGWTLQAASRLGTAARGNRFADEAVERFADAESDFRRAIELGLPDDLRYALLMNRGVLRYYREKYEEAAADFSQAIELDATRYHAHASLAQTLRRLGQPAEAIERMSQAIERAPQLPALYRGRALARLSLGTPTGAEAELVLADLEQSSRLEPTGSRAAAGDQVVRGKLLLTLHRHRDALDAAQAALTLAPDRADAHLVRLTALLELKQYDMLIESCDAVLSGHETAELHRIRGLARFRLNLYAGAIDDLSRALALGSGEDSGLRRTRGWAHLFAGEAEQAREDFEAVLHDAPRDPDGLAGRGAARVHLGQLGSGLRDAEESLQLATTHRMCYIASQSYAEASTRAAAEAAPRGRPATQNSIAYEHRAAELLEQALKRLPDADRPTFWREAVEPNAKLQPVLRNPRLRQQLLALVRARPQAH